MLACIISNILLSTLKVRETLLLLPFIFQSFFLKFPFDMSVFAEDGKAENSKS